MARIIECPCGHELGFGTPSAAIDCPVCGRTLVPSNRATVPAAVWVATGAAVGLFAAAVGLVGAFVAVTLLGRPSTQARVDDPTSQTVFAQPTIAPPKSAEPEPIAPLPPVEAPTPEQPAPPPKPDPVPSPSPTPPPKAEPKPPTVVPAGRYRVGDSFDQDVLVSRKSAFRVLGAEVGQAAQYSFASSVVVTKVHTDGSLVAEQRIRAAKLIKADASTRGELAAALEQTQGAKFEINVKSNGDVTDLNGLKDPIRVQLAGPNAVPGQSLRMWSLLDADAWKELAGLTFFQPDKPLEAGVTWSRPVTHDWGPLGTWRGKTDYVVGRQAPKAVADKIDYRHDIYHRSPAAGADRDLPFRVLKTEFQTVLAGGAILYDHSTRRTTAAEETFRVRGTAMVSVAGTSAAVEMEELQGFRLTVTDRTKRELSGNPK